jgi:hypothetical protein
MASNEDILTPLKSAFRNLSIASPMRAVPPPSSTRWNIACALGTPPSWPDQSSVAESSDELGSKSNHHVIIVNAEYPEKHLHFDVQYVKSMKHGNFVRSGFHIHAETSIKDIHTWSATMYQGPGFKNRSVVLIKAPSCTSWFDNIDDYHRHSS